MEKTLCKLILISTEATPDIIRSNNELKINYWEDLDVDQWENQTLKEGEEGFGLIAYDPHSSLTRGKQSLILEYSKLSGNNQIVLWDGDFNVLDVDNYDYYNVIAGSHFTAGFVPIFKVSFLERYCKLNGNIENCYVSTNLKQNSASVFKVHEIDKTQVMNYINSLNLNERLKFIGEIINNPEICDMLTDIIYKDCFMFEEIEVILSETLNIILGKEQVKKINIQETLKYVLENTEWKVGTSLQQADLQQ